MELFNNIKNFVVALIKPLGYILGNIASILVLIVDFFIQDGTKADIVLRDIILVLQEFGSKNTK